MDELLVWWFMWVNSNLDILIMTITLIVVTGLVLEVVRLNRLVIDNKRIAAEAVDYANDRISFINDGQVDVNVHLAEDIAELQKKVDLLGKVVGEIKFKKPGKKK